MLLCLVTFLTLAACVARANYVCCQNTGCFDDERHFKHLPLPFCEQVVNPEFLLFTRNNEEISEKVYITPKSVSNLFSPRRKTYFLIHGYGNSKDTEWLNLLKQWLLYDGDNNVIIVGWGSGAKTIYYPQAASNTRVVGAAAANIVDALVAKGANRALIHCIGHSLGAHTCGHLGERTRIGRISGLDPAGPKFGSYPPEARLNPGDADFVDVIHTMGKEGFILDFGTMTPLGHVDFYPNGGGTQPGCLNFNNDMHLTPYGIIGCSHSRAVSYYIESIALKCFAT